jgi:hypothetical protein
VDLYPNQPAPVRNYRHRDRRITAVRNGFNWGDRCMITRIKRILLSPRSEWQVIAAEPTTIAQLYTDYIVVLAVVAAALSFIRSSVIGIRVPFGDAIRLPVASGLMSALFAFVMGLVGLFVVAMIINFFAATFGGQKDQRQALKSAAYAFTPAYLSAVFYLLPSMGTLLQFIAGLYGIYLLYLGLPVLMRSKPEGAAGYTASVVICTIVLSIVIGAVAATFGAGFGRMSGLGAAAMSRQAEQERAAAQTGNLIGNMLGTDQKGKAGIGAAISNLVKAGEQAQRQQQAAAAATSNAGAAPAPATATATAGTGTAAVPGSATGDSAAAAPGIASATTGLVTALGGALGGSERVAAVDFHSLQALLPTSLPDMTRTRAQGSDQSALGVKTSSAVGDYQNNSGGHAKVTITDISAVAGLMDIANGLVGATHSESSSAYEKDTTISGRAVHEKYDAAAGTGEVDTVVAKRFDVDITGAKVDMPTLEHYLDSIDLSKLESMKSAGAGAQ